MSGPEYSGSASVLQEIILGGNCLEIDLRIFRVFPLLVKENAVFLVDCPDCLGYLSEKVRKHGFGWTRRPSQCSLICLNLSFTSMCELSSGRSWCKNQV